jgi:hypothetical protein
VRRNIVLILVAALALSIGFSNVAAADRGGADASAKRAGKKAKRGKRCKGKRGKAKKRCQRGKGRRNANWLKVGKYVGMDGVEVEIRSRKRVLVTFPQAPATCLFFPGGAEDEDAKLTAKKLTAGFVAPPGAKGFIQRWQLTVYPNYQYKLVIDSSTTQLPGTTPCDKPGATFTGKLKKTG